MVRVLPIQKILSVVEVKDKEEEKKKKLLKSENMYNNVTVQC